MNIACSGIQLSVSTLKNTFSCSFVSPRSLIISTNRGIITIYELRRLAFTMGWWWSPPFKTSYYYDLPSNDLANYRLHLTPTFKSLCLQQRHTRWERNVFQPWDSGGSHLPEQSPSAEHSARLVCVSCHYIHVLGMPRSVQSGSLKLKGPTHDLGARDCQREAPHPGILPGGF